MAFLNGPSSFMGFDAANAERNYDEVCVDYMNEILKNQICSTSQEFYYQQLNQHGDVNLLSIAYLIISDVNNVVNGAVNYLASAVKARLESMISSEQHVPFAFYNQDDYKKLNSTRKKLNSTKKDANNFMLEYSRMNNLAINPDVSGFFASEQIPHDIQSPLVFVGNQEYINAKNSYINNCSGFGFNLDNNKLATPGNIGGNRMFIDCEYLYNKGLTTSDSNDTYTTRNVLNNVFSDNGTSFYDSLVSMGTSSLSVLSSLSRQGKYVMDFILANPVEKTRIIASTVAKIISSSRFLHSLNEALNNNPALYNLISGCQIQDLYDNHFKKPSTFRDAFLDSMIKPEVLQPIIDFAYCEALKSSTEHFIKLLITSDNAIINFSMFKLFICVLRIYRFCYNPLTMIELCKCVHVLSLDQSKKFTEITNCNQTIEFLTVTIKELRESMAGLKYAPRELMTGAASLGKLQMELSCGNYISDRSVVYET